MLTIPQVSRNLKIRMYNIRLIDITHYTILKILGKCSKTIPK